MALGFGERSGHLNVLVAPQHIKDVSPRPSQCLPHFISPPQLLYRHDDRTTWPCCCVLALRSVTCCYLRPVRLAELHTDNLPPPSVGGSPRAISRATYDAIFNIRQALYKFGIITSFRAYVGSMSLQTKWELQSHGVTVVECLWNASETMITGRPLSLLFALLCRPQPFISRHVSFCFG